ncbi:uncharacterized protein [Periplaneta americana]|uniref:uncharacterized protein isoform X3 n=1 Tax=Periplaneta americana TaxID=6978 RepID=UPI0037E80BD6
MSTGEVDQDYDRPAEMKLGGTPPPINFAMIKCEAEEENLLDLQVSGIKTESFGHHYNVASEMKFGETDEPANFAIVKSEPEVSEEESYFFDSVQEGLKQEVTTEETESFSDRFGCGTMSRMSGNESSNDELSSSVVDVDKLILEVQKRPVLYNKTLEEYNNRSVKEKLWGEVCTNVVSNWIELSAKEKAAKGMCKEVQKRWKNLRDCFARELANQRKTVPGQSAKKRRKYLHFDSLSFLLPSGEARPSSSKITPSKKSNQEIEKHYTPQRTRKTSPTQTSQETSFLRNILQSKQREEIDEDKSFALMLVPMLKRLNDEQKHYARIGILNVMRNAKNIQPTSGIQRAHHGISPAPSACNDAHTAFQAFQPAGHSQVISPSASSECSSVLFDL